MWKKVEKTTANWGRGRRMSPGYRRTSKLCVVVLPEGVGMAGRYDWLSEGTKLGIRFSPSGLFSAFKQGKGSRLTTHSVPTSLWHMFPEGSGDMTIADDDGVLVIDTAQFGGGA